VREVVKLGAVIAIVAGAAFGFVSLQEGKGYGLKEGALAPALNLRTLAGGSTDLGSLRGRLVVVNFWATWCPPCVAEMPSLERAHRALGAEGLVVLGVSVDEDEGAVREFVARQGVSFPILRDPGGRAAAAYRTTGYPETFLVGPEGTVRKIFVGPAEWDTPEALAYFRALLPRRRVDTDRSTSPTR